MSPILKKQIDKNRLSHAYLFVSSNSESQFNETKELIESLQVSQADTFYLESQENIKVAEIRSLVAKISLKPHSSKYKIFIIPESDKLTREAANSLLKVLEEPPGQSIIILFSRDEKNLLPTIISRCQKIMLANTEETKLSDDDKIFLTRVNEKTIKEKFVFAEEVSQREDLAATLDSWLAFYREKMLTGEDVVRVIEIIIKAKKYLAQNVNTKLLLENITLEMV